jgi:eukaryotic-like serine/threonine-protein kinase
VLLSAGEVSSVGDSPHEARAAQEFEHRHLLRVLDFGEAAGRPFVVFQYAAGGSLADRLQVGALGLDDTVRLQPRVERLVPPRQRPLLVSA